MKTRCLLFSLFLLLVLPARAQWTAHMEDTTLHFRCDYCPVQCRSLVVGFHSFQIGDATAVDLEYLDYTSTPVLSVKSVPLDGSDTAHYGEFIWFITNAYGWVEMLVHYPGGTYTYTVPTIQAYEAESIRGY